MPPFDSPAPSARSATAPLRIDCFSVAAAAGPGTLPRILEAFAQRSLVPARVHAAQLGQDELAVDLQVGGLDADSAERVAARLRALVDVRAVLTYTKPG